MSSGLNSFSFNSKKICPIWGSYNCSLGLFKFTNVCETFLGSKEVQMSNLFLIRSSGHSTERDWDWQRLDESIGAGKVCKLSLLSRIAWQWTVLHSQRPGRHSYWHGKHFFITPPHKHIHHVQVDLVICQR